MDDGREITIYPLQNGAFVDFQKRVTLIVI